MVGNSFVCPSEVFGKCLVDELNFKMISDNIQPPCTSGVKPVSGKFPGFNSQLCYSPLRG